jgi:hypothetical protein
MKITKSKLRALILEEIDDQLAPVQKGDESQKGDKIYVVDFSSHDGRTQASFKTEQSAKSLKARLEKEQKFVEDNRSKLRDHELTYNDKETGQKFRFSVITSPTRIRLYTMPLHQ